MVHYVVLCDWAISSNEIASGVSITAVEHTLEDAKRVFINASSSDKQYAKENNWEIFTDTDTEFDAGESGYYASEHIRFYIEEVFDRTPDIVRDLAEEAVDRDIEDCPLGGDISEDCADCVYSDDYHFVDGECKEREVK